MATVTTRPAEVCAVGGSFPNPIIYILTTIQDFEVIEVRKGDTTLLTDKLFGSAFGGVCEVDLSGFLQSYLQDDKMSQSDSYIDTGGAIQFYIVGSGFTEVANKRLAVISKINKFDSDITEYALDVSLAETLFLSAFDVVPHFTDCFLSIINYTDDMVFLREIEYDINQTILNTVLKFIDIKQVKGLLRIFVAMSLLSACTTKECTVQVAPQLITNYHFDNGLTGWANIGQNTFTALAPSFARLQDTGGASNGALRQSVTFPNAFCRLFIKYKSLTPITLQARGYDDPQPSYVTLGEMPASADYTYFQILLDAQAGTRNFDINFVYGDLPAIDMQIDFISLTNEDALVDASEVKTLEQVRECNASHLISWQAPIGSLEHYAFTNFEKGVKRVGEPKEFMQYGNRFENIAEVQARETIKLSTIVPKEHLKGLLTVLFSKSVYLHAGEELIYAKVVDSAFPLENDTDNFYDVSITLDLPFYNS